MIYADYVASGRALRQIEDAITNEVLPYYANSHTEASFCGQMMTRLRAQARQVILDACNGDDDHALVFTGSGATAALNRLVKLLGVDQPDQKPLVLIGPYEHHSNILPWRESGAEMIEIAEAPNGGPDMDVLEAHLAAAKGRLVVGAFSAASNVTGIVTDVVSVTQLLKKYGALSVWDYAGGGPYQQIDLSSGIDAVVVSPHKFIGGPGASGLLILRRDAVSSCVPSLPGGGTVRFVSPWAHDYSDDVTTREEAGTPNVVGDIRAALCFLVKEAIGQATFDTKLEAFRQRALRVWSKTPGLHIFGNENAAQVLPIFSFQIFDAAGNHIHQQLVTRILSDHYGIQARGGCACAGPYAHRLLGIAHDESETLRQSILGGQEMAKPGWTRLGFSVLMSDEKVDAIIQAVDQLARSRQALCANYRVDESTARFSAVA
jgi:selenocysteine lyase/cysteine desulfurase